jgi:hypothetical protein
MPQEQKIEAALLTGYSFFRHPDNPALGIFRFETENSQLWALVTRKDLLSLAETCIKNTDALT